MEQTEANNQPWPGSGKAWYAVSILVVAFIFSFVDRIIISLLVGPIKRDLDVTDFGFGMLAGPAFAIFYALVGIPIGRWSDRHSRRRIISIGIFIWSVMTAVCGLARNFWQLLIARVGVGVGQAALSPAAYSMISDYFPKQKLGRALGVYQAGAFFGAGIALLVGGIVIRLVSNSDELVLPVLGAIQTWQIVFFVVGLPGVLVAFLMWTVEEPLRRGTVAGHEDGLPLGIVVRYIWGHRRLFISHFFGFTLLALPITTTLIWVPEYFIRVLGNSPADTGVELGTVLIFASPAGVLFGGWLVDTLQRMGYVDATFRVGIMAAAVLLPISYFATSGTDADIAFYLFGPFVFLASITMAVAPAALQLVTPNQMRAQVSALWMLVLNIFSAIIAGAVVGLITEKVLSDNLAVGQSIALVNCFSMPFAALLLWTGLRSFRAAVAAQPAGA